MIGVGLKNTLILALASTVFGVLIGMGLAILGISRSAWLRFPARVYTDIFRGLPAIVTILLIGQGFARIGRTIFGPSPTFAAAPFAEPMLQRDWRTTNFSPSYSAAVPAGSGDRTEGWLLTPTTPGTNTLTIQASRGDSLSDTKAIAIVTCAASAGAGTKRLLMMGDSLVEGNAGQTTLTALPSQSRKPSFSPSFSWA
eukprot:gene66432-90937_t